MPFYCVQWCITDFFCLSFTLNSTNEIRGFTSFRIYFFFFRNLTYVELTWQTSHFKLHSPTHIITLFFLFCDTSVLVSDAKFHLSGFIIYEICALMVFASVLLVHIQRDCKPHELLTYIHLFVDLDKTLHTQPVLLNFMHQQNNLWLFVVTLINYMYMTEGNFKCQIGFWCQYSYVIQNQSFSPAALSTATFEVEDKQVFSVTCVNTMVLGVWEVRLLQFKLKYINLK